MKKIALILAFTITSFSAFSQSYPQCRDRNGNILNGTLNELRQIMSSNAYRPQAYAIGVINAIYPDDTQGLPHQKFSIIVGGQINIQVVSNLDFGRTPVQMGQTVAVCGEYLNVGSGMIHWTHIDPHGGHANGFTFTNGQMYGQQQVATTGEQPWMQ